MQLKSELTVHFTDDLTLDGPVDMVAADIDFIRVPKQKRNRLADQCG